jgi:hypothetical protein
VIHVESSLGLESIDGWKVLMVGVSGTFQEKRIHQKTYFSLHHRIYGFSSEKGKKLGVQYFRGSNIFNKKKYAKQKLVPIHVFGFSVKIKKWFNTPLGSEPLILRNCRFKKRREKSILFGKRGKAKRM